MLRSSAKRSFTRPRDSRTKIVPVKYFVQQKCHIINYLLGVTIARKMLPNVQPRHLTHLNILIFIPLMYQSCIFSVHCIFGAAFFWYFIENKNAIGPIVTELGKFTDFLSHEHKIIVISLFRCD